MNCPCTSLGCSSLLGIHGVARGNQVQKRLSEMLEDKE